MRGGKDGQFQHDPYRYFEHRLELFSPPYVFAGSRPQITSAPGQGGYRQDVAIGCPAPGDIARVALYPRRLGHAWLPHGPALRRART
jgi:hypothetical protein